MRISLSVKCVNSLLLLFYDSFVSNVLSFCHFSPFDSLINLKQNFAKPQKKMRKAPPRQVCCDKPSRKPEARPKPRR